MATNTSVKIMGQIKSQKLSNFYSKAKIWPEVGIANPEKLDMIVPLLRIEDHTSDILTCEFHHTGKLFLSSGTDKRVHVGDVIGDSRKYMMMTGHTGAINEAHFSRIGLEVYTCSSDRTLGIWDPFKGVRTDCLIGHTNSVNSVQCSKKGPHLLCSGSSDGTVKIWDARGKQCVLTFDYGSRVTSTCFNETGELVMAGGYNNDIQIRDLRMNKIVTALEGHEALITGIALSPCGRYLLSQAKDNSLRMWQIAPTIKTDSVGFIHSISTFGYKNFPRCKWSADGTKISGGSSDAVVYVWNPINGNKLCELSGHEHNITDVTFHPKIPIVLSASKDSSLVYHELSPNVLKKYELYP